MINLSFPKDWLVAIKQLSPSMLLLSLTLHGLLLLMPLSSSPERKISHGKTTSKQQPIVIYKSESSQFFSNDKALVTQKDLSNTLTPSNNPQFTSQLPLLPQDTTIQTQLPIPEIQATPILPLPEVRLPVAPASSNVGFASFQEVQQATDTTAAVVIAPKTAPLKKQNNTRTKAPIKPKTVVPATSPIQEAPKPVVTLEVPVKESASPEVLPHPQEKETFDNILNKLNQELNLSEEVNFSQPEKFSPTIEMQRVYGVAVGKTPEQVAASIISKLELQGFKVSQINNYIGGLVYIVTKNKFIEYISFTSDIELTGTVIIIWSNL